MKCLEGFKPFRKPSNPAETYEEPSNPSETCQKLFRKPSETLQTCVRPASKPHPRRLAGEWLDCLVCSVNALHEFLDARYEPGPIDEETAAEEQEKALAAEESEKALAMYYFEEVRASCPERDSSTVGRIARCDRLSPHDDTVAPVDASGARRAARVAPAPVCGGMACGGRCGVPP